MKETFKILFVFVFTIVITFFITKCVTENKYDADISNLNSAYSDTLVKVRNDKGQLETKTRVLETGNLELLEMLGKNDEVIKELSDVIDKHSGRNKELQSALIIKNHILAQYRDSLNNSVTNYVTINDTMYPTYERDFNLYNRYNSDDTVAWVYGRVLLGKIDFDILIHTVNEYNVVIGRERKNMFSGWQSYALITNKNPYDNTEKVRVYNKGKADKKRFVIAGVIGGGFGNDGMTPFIGIAFGVKLIEF